ncbi:hypothetical protein Sme01_39870 [Sphaerisporangium melleum]|uniref:Peptidase M48 domain-containing protein n=1 Tax=Sphaerisporangium melleum TaxID=321316 RepID=A0A917VIG7_9ACTN|nr:M48 family metalloprotease [Sphaerisporangium melleum]GGK86426.1 hypothetical protein GCM10007964_31290 [Sphaerisporangium melleum]GII71511.1 hypothetical protein Sme01_39870 [Sphaerisporangium melleum]
MTGLRRPDDGGPAAPLAGGEDTGLVPETGGAPPAHRPVNPFLLPAATVSRFILLITITLSAAGSTFDLIAGGPSHWWVYLSCNRTADTAALQAGGTDTLIQSYLSCLEDLGLRTALQSFGAMAVTALVIVAVYLARPWITIRRQHLVPADRQTHTELHATMRRLAESEGLRRVPRILLDASRRTPGGRAFGHYPRYYLRLNVGTLHRARRPGGGGVVEAVALHELAHLRNRDVDLTGLTQAAVWVFPALVSAPIIVYTTLTAPANLLDVATRTLLTSVLVAVLAAAVLRSREHYADVRAAIAGARLPEPEPPSAAWWRALLPLHPRDDRRAKVVHDPGLLMRWVPGEALGAGLAAGMGATHLSSVLRVLLLSDERPAWLISSLVYAAPATAIVLAGAYRSTLRALSAGRRAPRGTAAGAALAAGILLGLLVSPSQISGSWAVDMSRAPLTTTFMAMILLGLCLVLCRWLTVVATAWLPAAQGRGLVPSYLAALVPAALVFGVGLHAWSMAMKIAMYTGDPAISVSFSFAQFLDPVLLTALLGAALYPLASWLRQRWPGRGRDLYLDQSTSVLLTPVRVRPLLALTPAALLLLAGVVGNLVTPNGLMIAIVRALGMRPGGDDLGDLLAQFSGLMLVIVTAQCLAAVFLAVRAGGGRAALGPSHAVLAAVTAGVAAALVIYVPPLAAVCSGRRLSCDVTMMRNGLALALSATVLTGILIALVGAGMVSAFRVLADLVRRHPRARDHTARPGRTSARGLLALLTVVLVVGWFAVMVPLWLEQSGYRTPPPPSLNQTSAASAVPPPGPPGTRMARDACAEVVRAVTTSVWGGEHFYVTWATAFAHLGESDRPFLVAVGRAAYPPARDTKFTFRESMLTVTNYCSAVNR